MGRLDEIFKAYDIRGRIDNCDLDESAAQAVGAGFARYTGAGKVAVGRDFRHSSDQLAAAFMQGVHSQGGQAVNLGQVPTEVVYYYSGRYDLPGAVITASHNPAQYNGIKLCGRGAAPIGEATGLTEIKHLAQELDRVPVPPDASRWLSDPVDPVPGFVDHVLHIAPPTIGPLRVAVDGGNGMAGVVIADLFDRLPAQLLGLYLQPDGSFPNHPADPIVAENLVDLIALVKEAGAQLGVGFDGDADRAVFVDEQGTPLSGSTTTSIICSWFLAQEPGACIVHNLICSRAVPEQIRAAGGRPVRTRVGHSFVKQVMAETKAVFGGEHSGHYYFRDNYGADSAMLAMLVLLGVMSESGLALSQLRQQYEKYPQSGEINLLCTDPPAALRAVGAAYPPAAQDFLDGITVDLGSGWFNLRPSNTEPLLRLNVEATDRPEVEEVVAQVEEIVAQF